MDTLGCGAVWWTQPEWWVVALTALGSFGALCVWCDRRIRENRDAMPIVRAKWRQGAEGVGVTVEFENRINEDLHVTRAEADVDFAEADPGSYDDDGVYRPGSLRFYRSPRALDISIPPKGKCEASFGLSGPGARRRIIVYVSSSNRALRDRRIVIDHKKPR